MVLNVTIHTIYLFIHCLFIYCKTFIQDTQSDQSGLQCGPVIGHKITKIQNKNNIEIIIEMINLKL